MRGRFRSVRLGWTDPESGERLTVDVRGAASFLPDLEPLGFEILRECGNPERLARTQGGAPKSESPADPMKTDTISAGLLFSAELWPAPGKGSTRG